VLKCQGELSTLQRDSKQFNGARYARLRHGGNQIDNFLSPNGSYVFHELPDVLEL